MNVGSVRAETVGEKISLFFDKLYSRRRVARCQFCQRTFFVYQTIYRKTKGNLTCSDICAEMIQS
jgi:hypothetical protein